LFPLAEKGRFHRQKKVKEIGEKVEAEERKKKILEIISAVLFILPIAGPIAAELAGFARLGVMIAWAGFAATEVMSVYEIVTVGILNLISTE
jgi:hypothetical protein